MLNLKLYALYIADMTCSETIYVASNKIPTKQQIKKLLKEHTLFDESDFAVYNHPPSIKSPRKHHDFNVEIKARGHVSTKDLEVFERLSVHKVVRL